MELKERLKNGEFVYGTWCILPSPEVINVLAKAGLDFVLIDMEHGSADFQCVQQMVMAANADGCAALVRVGDNQEIDVLRALETGAAGIIVPHVETVEHRKQAISYMKYPPVGIRGYSPYARAGGYQHTPGYTENENQRILSGVLIEGTNGIKDIKSIINDEELDLVYIGTYDISAMLGLAGDVQNPKVIEALKECVQVVRESGKFAACLFHSPAELQLFKEIGIQVLCYKVDTAVLLEGFQEFREWEGERN